MVEWIVRGEIRVARLEGNRLPRPDAPCRLRAVAQEAAGDGEARAIAPFEEGLPRKGERVLLEALLSQVGLAWAQPVGICDEQQDVIWLATGWGDVCPDGEG